jgi:hypothetical protein
LETPQFDAEETLLAARPVVPLSEEALEAARSSSNNTRAAVAARPLTKRIPVLALVIIGAVSVGLASGLAIGLYQGRQQRANPATAQPSLTRTTEDTRLKQQPAEETSNRQLPSVQTVADGDKPTEPVVVAQSESGQIVVPEEVPETKASPRTSDIPKPEREASRDKDTQDEKPAPAATRKKAQNVREDDDGSDKNRRLMRRRRTVERDRDDDVPQRIERTGQELNRIREIFEGARP